MVKLIVGLYVEVLVGGSVLVLLFVQVIVIV